MLRESRGGEFRVAEEAGKLARRGKALSVRLQVRARRRRRVRRSHACAGLLIARSAGASGEALAAA